MQKHGRSRYATGDNKIWRMRIACWIPTATDTYSEHVIIIAFLLQQWLCETASLWRHTYVAFRVIRSYWSMYFQFLLGVSENSIPLLHRKSNLCHLKTKNGPALCGLNGKIGTMGRELPRIFSPSNQTQNSGRNLLIMRTYGIAVGSPWLHINLTEQSAN